AECRGDRKNRQNRGEAKERRGELFHGSNPLHDAVTRSVQSKGRRDYRGHAVGEEQEAALWNRSLGAKSSGLRHELSRNFRSRPLVLAPQNRLNSRHLKTIAVGPRDAHSYPHRRTPHDTRANPPSDSLERRTPRPPLGAGDGARFHEEG